MIGLALVASLEIGSLLAQATPSDRALTLNGVWTCAGNAWSQPGSMSFSVAPRFISMSYAYPGVEGTTYELNSTFAYDPASATWALEQKGAQYLEFRGIAGRWTAQTWVFDGTIYPPNTGEIMYYQPEHARITFIAFGDNVLEMIRSQEVGGQWVSHDPWTSSVLDVTCTR